MRARVCVNFGEGLYAGLRAPASHAYGILYLLYYTPVANYNPDIAKLLVYSVRALIQGTFSKLFGKESFAQSR